MDSADALAASWAPGEEIPALRVGDLTEDDTDSVIRFDGRTVRLLEVADGPPDVVGLIVRSEGQDYDSPVTLHPDHPYELVSRPARPADVVDTTKAEQYAREMDRISQRITALDAELPVLRKRKVELSDLLLEHLAEVGEKNFRFDARVAFLYPELIPEFELREDGRRYTLRDLVPVLESLGRHDAIKPAEAGWEALLSIFREYRKAELPLPPELAAMVRPRTVHTVRIGAGKAIG